MSNPHDPRFQNTGYGAPGNGPTPLGDRGAPWPAPGSARPAEIPTWGAFQTTGNPFQRTPLAEVWSLIPVGTNLALQPRVRPITFDVDDNGAVVGRNNINLQFSRPSVLFQMTASAVATGQGAAIAGDPRDTFRIQMQRSNGQEELINAPALGSTVLGSAERPFKVAPNGWTFDRGESLIVTITPLRADLSIDITLTVAEITGPANFTWSTIPPHP